MTEEFTERQKEILQVALDIIREENIDSLTFRGIAEKLGVTEPAIYRHFKDKSAFIETLYIYAEEKLKKISAGFKPGQPAVEQLRRLLEQFLSHLGEVRAVYLVLLSYSIVLNDEKLKKRMLNIFQTMRARIISILENGVEQGAFRADIELEATATAILGLIQSRCIIYRLSNSSPVPAEAVDELVELLIKGLQSQ